MDETEGERRADTIDLGSNHILTFHAWSPDRALNPQYADMPDVERYGASIVHLRPDGQPCAGGLTFDGPVQRELASRSTSPKPVAMWRVESWDPLTISPSVRCSCGDHGFIRNGRWESCAD